ncbi:unnamed protein product [Heterobilharzia americana]|nr:unnamed protein product [Heterobilharzia americana]
MSEMILYYQENSKALPYSLLQISVILALRKSKFDVFIQIRSTGELKGLLKSKINSTNSSFQIDLRFTEYQFT